MFQNYISCPQDDQNYYLSVSFLNMGENSFGTFPFSVAELLLAGAILLRPTVYISERLCHNTYASYLI